MYKIGVFWLLLFSAIVQAQNIKISGHVFDSQTHEPVINALIQVVKTKTYSETDNDGYFTMEVPELAVLSVQHIAYESLNIKAEKSMQIMLKPKRISLDEIIVKSNPLEDISHSIVVLDKVKKGSQSRNVADLFKDIPGFGIQKRSATAMEPSLRSFKYEEMNIKYDGGDKMVHACPNRMDPITAHVIPESVRKIEVVKGPFTVRFGQVFGGVVNMITRQPAPEDYGIHGSLQSGYEMNGNNLVLRADLLYATKKFDISVDGEHRDFNDYIDGNAVLTPAGFKHSSYALKLGYMPTENQRIQVNWHQKFGRDIKHAGLPMDSPKDNSQLAGLDYKINAPAGSIKYIQLKSYYTFVDHLMTNGYGMDVARPNYPKIDARTPVSSTTKGGKLEIALKPEEHWIIYTGIDADFIQRNGTKTVIIHTNMNTGTPLNPPVVKKMKVWQDAYVNDLGIYAETNKKISDTYFVNIGVRTDYVYSQALNPAEGFTAIYGEQAVKKQLTWGGSMALKYRKNHLQMQLAYGRGVRTPSMLERYIYRFIVGKDSREYIGDPDLKPEINNQIEYALERKWEKLQAGSSVFYSYFQDYITPVVEPGLTASSGGNGTPKAPKVFRNVDAHQYGFDAFVGYQFNDRWLFKTDVALTKAYNLSLDEPLSQIAPPDMHFEVKYEKAKYWIDFKSEWVLTQKDYAPSFLETGTPGHITFDMRAGVKPYKGLSIGMAVLNITDEAYYNHLNFAFKNANDLNGQHIFEPGRSISIYAKYKF